MLLEEWLKGILTLQDQTLTQFSDDLKTLICLV